ncbi:TatD family hydrolase [Kocuria varians]|uniref:TatD family hydrolase n=1 Tax=Kocuria varians TaxID=1272 RepID=UPI000837C3C4|nr:TatD family hydrolase [Kocuria varians]
MIETPLTETVFRDAGRPAAVPGETPPAYRPEMYAVADATGEVASGEGTERRAHTDAQGQRRNLSFPALPEPLPHPVVDDHTHLDMQDGLVRVSVADAVAVARDASVAGLVQAGCDVESSRFAVSAAQTVPGVLAAVALHPNEAPSLAAAGSLESALAEISELAGQDRVRAIGETGMDRAQTPEEGLAAQEESFRAHIRMAKEHGLAMQIHDRDAHEDVLRILRDEGAPERTVFHCFSGDPELAQVCNENGWYMSFAGTVTFKNAKPLQAALRVADPALVLSETDAPFLTPHPFRGRPNAPYMVNYTVRGMATLLETDLETLCRRIWDNARAVYGEF